MTPPKGKRCQVCGYEVGRIKNNGNIDYCNMCKKCGRVVHTNPCVWKLRDVRIAGDFWICQCGERNQIYTCEDWDYAD